MVLNKSLSDIEEPVPASSPVMTFDASSTVHVYVVPTGTIPLVPSTGVISKLPISLHITSDIGSICGSGFTVMVKVIGSPGHSPLLIKTGVTWNSANIIELVLFTEIKSKLPEPLVPEPISTPLIISQSNRVCPPEPGPVPSTGIFSVVNATNTGDSLHTTISSTWFTWPLGLTSIITSNSSSHPSGVTAETM